MALGSTGSSDHMAPAAAWPMGINMFPGNWLDPRYAEFLVATGVMDTITDPNLCMALGSSPCLDLSMAPGSSISHPDQHGPRHNMILGH